MNVNSLRFGQIIAQKRAEKKLTLRAMAGMIGISAPYLLDIEKGRRNPPEKSKIEKMFSILKITGEEKDIMFDLAGKERGRVSPDFIGIYYVQRSYQEDPARGEKGRC